MPTKTYTVTTKELKNCIKRKELTVKQVKNIKVYAIHQDYQSINADVLINYTFGKVFTNIEYKLDDLLIY
jgi:S-adenosylmethionine hydrolase